MFNLSPVFASPVYKTGQRNVNWAEQPVALVSSRYSLVTPDQLVAAAARNGMSEVSRLLNRTGARSWHRFVVDGVDGIPGYAPMVSVANSYDGRASLRAQTGVMRLVCANGTVGECAIARAVKRHSGAIDLDAIFAQLLDSARGDALQYVERLEALRGVPSDTVMFRGYCLPQVADNVVKRYGQKRLVELADQRYTRDAWGLVQSLTDYAHEVPPAKRAFIEAAAGSIVREYQIS